MACVAAAGLAAGPRAARAQANPLPAASDTAGVSADTAANGIPVALPALSVEAFRESRSSLHAPQRLTALGPEAIAQTGARTVADVLEQRSGLFVKRYGMGGLATVSLRGTGSQQTVVLLDGQRAVDPQSGQVDLSLLPTVALEGVDVAYGTRSAQYGSGGLGGAVRLRTLTPTKDLQVKTTGQLGAYGEETGGLVASGGTGSVAGLVAIEASQVAGDFPYTNTTRVTAPVERRAGADRSLRTALGKLRYEAGGARLSVTAWYSDVERGLPGAADGSPAEARQWDRHLRLLVRSETRFGWGTLDVRGSSQITRLRYANFASQPDLRIDETTRGQSHALTTTVRRALGTRAVLLGGITGGLDRSSLDGGIRQTRTAAFTEATLFFGRAEVTPALRADLYASAGRTTAALSPQLGLSVQPTAWAGWRLKGSVGRAFRMPSFNERFYEPGGTPDLRPEDGWSAEAGTALALGRGVTRLQAEATAFATQLRDQIVWQPSFVGPGVQVWKPANVARVRSLGAELSASGQAQLASQVQVDGGLFFTHVAAENRSAQATKAYGRQLPYVPRQQLKVHAGAAWCGLRADMSGRLVGPRFLTADESQQVPAYRVADAQLGYRRTVGPVRLGLSVALRNALDARYSVIRFYPMPPRHAEVRLTATTTF